MEQTILAVIQKQRTECRENGHVPTEVLMNPDTYQELREETNGLIADTMQTAEGTVYGMKCVIDDSVADIVVR